MSGKISDRFHLDSRWDKIFFIGRILILAILVLLLLVHPSWYMNKTSHGIHLMKKRLLAFLFFDFVILVLPCAKLKYRGKRMYLWHILMIIGSLFVIFEMGEYAMQYHFYSKAILQIALNMLLLFTISLVFYVITNRIKVSLIMTYVLIIGFAIVNYFVYQFRGEPINAADLFTVGTALNVADGYSFDLNENMYMSLYVGALLMAVLGFLPEEVPWMKGKRRVLIAVPALIFSLFIGYVFTLSDWPLNIGIEVKVFNPYKYYDINGEALNFIRGFYYMKQDKPEGYTSEYINQLMVASGYTSDEADADDGQTNPNVIVIMNESLTDFTTYDSIELSDDPLEYIHSLEGSSNAITGNLNVNVFGGFTANTEYEYLTGNSISFLASSAVPYALYVRSPQPSATWNMRDMGYSGDIAFHPYLANCYSRPRAYENLGFKEFISYESIKEQINNKTDRVRTKLSDNADFEWIEKLYTEERESTDDPFYLFNITFQNHGGYPEDYKNFEQDIDVTGEFADDSEFKRYINLVDYSDEAFEALTEYYEKVDEPTIIVMFGDHRPNFQNSFYEKLCGGDLEELSTEDTFRNYTTPLVIWANYDINEGGKYDEEFSDISVNYLNAALSEVAGLPQTAYQKFLNSMRKELPVFTLHGYKDTSGNIYAVNDTASPYYDLVNEYHSYVYNNQFDSNNRNDSFFMLDSDDNAMLDAEQN